MCSPGGRRLATMTSPRTASPAARGASRTCARWLANFSVGRRPRRRRPACGTHVQSSARLASCFKLHENIKSKQNDETLEHALLASANAP
eukprot:scaffold3497_cov153-Isochrysis_galbana.AAC.4